MTARPPWVGLTEEDTAAGVGSTQQAGGTTLHISSAAQAHVDAYLEYLRVVGGDDGGQLLTEEEYEQFKRRARRASRAEQRLYVTWRNAAGRDCKAIGPATLCECGHRYREHANDAVGAAQGSELRCRSSRCTCRAFAYLPSAGAWNAKCACKHSAMLHDAETKACTRCTACIAFHATFTCGCGSLWAEHCTVVETRQQRQAAGRQVDNVAGGGVGYAALGGIVDFSSLTDAYTAVQHGLAALPLDAERPLASRPSDALQRLKLSRARARSEASTGNAAVTGAAEARLHSARSMGSCSRGVQALPLL